MDNHEIVTQLFLKYRSEEVIFSISMADLLSALARRYGVKALDFSDEDLELIKDELISIIEHEYLHLEKDLIESSLDAYEIVRNL